MRLCPLPVLSVVALVSMVSASAAETRRVTEFLLCDDRDILVNELSQEYGERRIWWGIAGDGDAVIELYLAPDTSSWTILKVEPSGTACALAGGDMGSFGKEIP